MNKKMKMKMCSMLLGLALFAACSSDDDVVTPQPKTYPLTIEVSENPLIPEGGAASAPATRAAITTISTLSQFNMNYVFVDNSSTTHTGSETATKTTDGKWQNSADADKGWPNGAVGTDHDYNVTWYAYTNGSFNLNSGNPYISFEAEEQADTQHDLLVSTASGTYADTGGHLFFAFDHACSALRFYVKKSTNLNDYTLSVSSIKLCNIIKKGDYYYNTSSWTLSGNRTEYTLYSGSAVTLGSTDYIPIYGTYGSAEAPYLFLIPQTLTAWDHTTNISSATTQTYLEIECTITQSSTPIYSGTAYIPFSATLEKGIKYENVNINIGWKTLYKSDGKLIFS